MGVAILSGVLKSLEARLSLPLKDDGANGREPPSGISTPTASQFLNAPEDTLPSNFVVTVGREETVRKLNKVFKGMGRLGEAVEVRGGPGVNTKTAAEADVILVWSVPPAYRAEEIEMDGVPADTFASSKPNMARNILSEEGMSEALDGKLVISICAGVTMAQLKSWVPSSTIVVRAMPNTPCKVSLSSALIRVRIRTRQRADSQVGAGMTVITPLSEAHHRSLLLAIFMSCGRARFMDEKYFDTCTAVAGSGPAFVALVLEAMADGGVMMGLPRAEALELAAQSEYGSSLVCCRWRCEDGC